MRGGQMYPQVTSPQPDTVDDTRTLRQGQQGQTGADTSRSSGRETASESTVGENQWI